MNTKIDVGGPAFPILDKANFCGTGSGDGMDLRDYFAAKAMPLAWKIFDEGYSTDDLTSENIARAAYQIADAMIKVREERVS